MLRCKHEGEEWVLKCNDRAWKRAHGQIMEGVKRGDQKKAKGEQLCSKVKKKTAESVPQY
jgi:hypothetical protein